MIYDWDWHRLSSSLFIINSDLVSGAPFFHPCDSLTGLSLLATVLEVVNQLLCCHGFLEAWPKMVVKSFKISSVTVVYTVKS